MIARAAAGYLSPKTGSRVSTSPEADILKRGFDSPETGL
jgi:hypothetical protein